jgi:hypothetical protein
MRRGEGVLTNINDAAPVCSMMIMAIPAVSRAG